MAPADLPFFLGLMEHLAKAGINCPTPVRDAERPHAARAGGQAGGTRHLPRGSVDQASAGAPLLGRGTGHGAAASGGPELQAQHGPMRWDLRAGVRSMPAFARAPRKSRPASAATIEQELDHLEANWPAEPAARHHPCRSVSRQRLLPRRRTVGIDRLLLRLQRRLRLRHRGDAQRLVLRDRPLLQCHQGPGAAQGLPERAHPDRGRAPGPAAAGARGGAALPAHPRLRLAAHGQRCAGAAARTRIEYLRRLKFHRSIRSASEYGLEDPAR